MKTKKKSILKKILKSLLVITLVILIALVSIPFLFKDKIIKVVNNTINNNINAQVTFKDADLSLLTNFPLVSLKVSDLAVINKAPFVGDTLYSSEELRFAMKITELFKKTEEVIEIKSIALKNGAINILMNKEGEGNFDIAKEATTETSSAEKSFSFDIQEYELENIDFIYDDKKSNLKVILEKINHSGKGSFIGDNFSLDTQTNTFLSFYSNKTNYVKKVKVSLDAILGIDLKNNTYSFKENKGYINQLPLEFEGFVQLLEDTQLYDLRFKTPTASFKNALGLLPNKYSGNLKTIQTKGDFQVKGEVKGTLSEKTIPLFDIHLYSKDASFKYADLPKSVEKINIDSRVVNKTGFIKDIYVKIQELNFKIDEDVFTTKGSIYNLSTNPKLDLAAKGTINLINIGKVYPVSLKEELEGVLQADITTNLEMNAIEKGEYQKIKNSGKITLHDFKYNEKDVANPFYISKAAISFDTNKIVLDKFNAKTGASDLSIKGNLENFYGFVFKDEVLKGNFSLDSETLKVSDFVTTEETKEEENSSALKLPSFLNINLKAKAKKVFYDNVVLSDVSGDVAIRDETIYLKNLMSSVFGGNIVFTGSVSTKEKVSDFKMDLNLKELDISDSFSQLEMLKNIAPIAKIMEGKINSTIVVSGLLNDDMTPDLKSISGDLLGQLLDTKLKEKDSKILTSLGSNMNFLDAKKLNLDKVTGTFSFDKGKVNVKPIAMNYNDIGMKVSGNHSFDKKMNYDIIFDVPVKYLGTEVTNLIAKLTPKEALSIKSIPVKGTLTGSFMNPNFSSNLKGATTTLVKSLVEKQKKDLLNKGKDKLKDLIGIGENSKKKDTLKKGGVEDKIKDVLGGLLGKKNN